MATTVTSLEERVDGIADDLSAVRSAVAVTNAQLATVVARLDGQGVQLTAVLARVENQGSQLTAMTSQIAAALVRLDEHGKHLTRAVEKLDALSVDAAGFKGRAETSMAFVRWVGVFLAGLVATTVLALLGGSITLGRYLGKLDESAERLNAVVARQEAATKELQQDVAGLRANPKP